MLEDSFNSIFDLFSSIDKKLKSPEKVAKEIEDEFLKQKMETMSKVYDLTIDFIIKKEGVLYGGFALNELLPKELKFYDKLTLPDYDCFIKNAPEVAKELADLLISKKYSYTEVKNALHENTYKIFSNFEAVADFTELNPMEQELIRDTAIQLYYKKRKILVCSKDILKAFAYIELCTPMSASHRWIKVYQRTLLFENSFPIKSDSSESISDVLKSKYMVSKDLQRAYSTIKDYLVQEKVLFCGALSVGKHLKSASVLSGPKHIEALSNEPERHLNCIIELLKNMKRNVKVVTHKNYEHLVPVHVDIFVKNERKFEKVVTLYDSTNHCFSYFNDNGRKISSIYFELYKMYITRAIHGSNKSDDLIIQHLVKVYESSKNNFTPECYGNFKTMSAIKKSVWDNNKRIVFYRPK